MMNREEFARENLNLVYRFLDVHHIRHRTDDILDVLYIGFVKALNNWDGESSEFSTYAFACMEKEYYKHLKYLKRVKRDMNIPVISLNTEIENGSGDISELQDFIADTRIDVEKEVMNNIIDEYFNVLFASDFLTEKEKFVFLGYYKEDKTIIDMGKELGITKQAVQKTKDRAVRKLRAYFRNADFKMLLKGKVEKQEDKEVEESIEENLINLFS